MSSRSIDPELKRLCNRLGYPVGRAALLEQALTHRSCGSPHNERLEFLGDAVLNLVVAEMLYSERPDASEGDLSRYRARLVREATLAELGQELQLGDFIRLGPGELKSGGFRRDSILADAVEALIGAIYLDAGFSSAAKTVESLLGPRVEALPDADALKDSKTRLQEWLQGRGRPRPDYEIVDEQGADHARRFTIRCRASGLSSPVEATAGSRRKAEQKAAKSVLEQLIRDYGP